MRSNQEYRNAALAALKGKWAPAVLCAVAIFAIVAVAMVPYGIGYGSYMKAALNYTNGGADSAMLLSGFMKMMKMLGLSALLSLFLLFPLYVGGVAAFNRLYTENDDRLTQNMFKYSFNGYSRNVFGIFLVYLFISLWSILLVIPGLIKVFSYALTPYILVDRPDLSANQAINLSRRMMKGHKFDLFCLFLSFIGWNILATLTLGIGLLWLSPYMYTTMSAFYQDVKAEYEAKTNAVNN